MKFEVTVHVPCSAIAVVEADSAERAFELVERGECQWLDGGHGTPDWKGAEATHAINLDTREETEA